MLDSSVSMDPKPAQKKPFDSEVPTSCISLTSTKRAPNSIATVKVEPTPEGAVAADAKSAPKQTISANAPCESSKATVTSNESADIGPSPNDNRSVAKPSPCDKLRDFALRDGPILETPKFSPEITCVKSEKESNRSGDTNLISQDKAMLHQVDIPEEEIDRNLPLMPQIVEYYKKVASYWPTDLIPFDSIVRPHKYYMEALDFVQNGKPNLIVFCESHANSPNVGAVECEEDLPFGYISLVHCLAYGESHLLSGGSLEHLNEAEKNSIRKGTIHFWKLLSVLAGLQDVRQGETDPLDSNTCFAFLLASANQSERLAAKKEIFRRLKDRRIALVDASLFPIYHGSWKETNYNKRTGTPYYTNMNPLKKYNLETRHLKVSWDYYAKPLVAHFRPRNVLILSKRLVLQAKGIEDFLCEHGGKYRGARIHPSTNLKNDARLVELMAIREIASSSL